MEFLTRPITSEKLEAKGQSIYQFSKIGMFIGACGFGLLLLICLICVALGGDFLDPIVFQIHYSYAWANLFVVIAYLAVLLGIASIPTYFAGLNIFALGRIANNTEKE